MQGGGFRLNGIVGGQGQAGNWSAMATGVPADANTGTGMVVYDSGPTGSPTTTGGFNINAIASIPGGISAGITLQGSTLTTTNSEGQVVPGPPYYNTLFWENRDARAHVGSNPPTSGGAHSLGQGNGCMSLIGTIYITNWLATMQADANHYQEVDYNGVPCSNTINTGYIIVSSLQIVGVSTIRMNLLPYGFMRIRQVALVH